MMEDLAKKQERSLHDMTLQEMDALYAIVSVGSHGAEIVDDGYRSLEEAQQAWPDALFKRVEQRRHGLSKVK